MRNIYDRYILFVPKNLTNFSFPGLNRYRFGGYVIDPFNSLFYTMNNKMQDEIKDKVKTNIILVLSN